jgi:CRISPR-associated protein (TIGR02584 family)
MSQLSHPHKQTILFAVSGMSPAIITETVWALAHEKPAIIPDRIVAVTTVAGRKAIERELFNAGTWDQLRDVLVAKRIKTDGKLRFGTTADDIRVFTRADRSGRSRELDDIRTPADNEAAADFLLEQLRPFTENPDIRLVCSLAGGRKTMGALLYACVSLIGREDDRLTHVLVNEPFDDPRHQPRFYFPTSRDRAARIELADVPFVPLRNLFPRELGRLPGHFTNLVQRYRTIVTELSEPPYLEFAEDDKVIRVNGTPVSLPVTAIALLDFLARRTQAGESPFAHYDDAIAPFQDFLAGWGKGHDVMNYRHDDAIKNLVRNCENQDLRKLVNSIKTGLAKAGIPETVAHHITPHRGHFGIRMGKISDV